MNETIVITDGITLNPGDLSWEPMLQFGKVEVHERSSAGEVKGRCRNASVIVTNKTPISAETMAAASGLKVIAVTATGYNIIDIDAARSRGIIVCNVPGYGTDSVAQHTFALILELVNHVGLNAKSVASGEWSAHQDFCYSVKPIVELAGKTLGLIGYGQIAKKVAEIAAAFGMRVIYNSPSYEKQGGASVVEVFSKSDIVSLHCPLTKSNAGFVNRDLLAMMKPTAILINTARGQLINEHDLADALTHGTISGAGLDVLSTEPPPANHPLIGIPNCIVTPHNAWYSFEARERMMKITIANIRLALSGKPQNIVS